MVERKAFSFMRSFFEAAKMLENKEDRADFLMAVCNYGLNGVEPETIGVTTAMFQLVKPNIDSALAKAIAGAKGGKASRKQTEANDKQNKANESNLEPIKDKGLRINDKGYKEKVKKESDPFEDFWKVYPNKKGKGAARKAFENAIKKGVTSDMLIDAVNRQRCGAQWTKDNGQFIPHPATWLNQERWDDEPEVDNVSNRPAGNPKNDTQLGFQRLLGFMGVNEEEQTDEQN